MSTWMVISIWRRGCRSIDYPCKALSTTLRTEGGDPMACFQLAELLVHESRTIYDGNINIPGFSSIPKALYWARKSVAESGLYVKGPGFEHSKEFIRNLEAKVQTCCAECDKDAKLMCCVR